MPAAALVIALLASAAVPQDGRPQPRSLEPRGLETRHLYNGLDAPAEIVARAGDGVEVVDLVLMDADGLVLAVPRSTAPGVMDLHAVMPAAAEIARDREAALYLQMLVEDRPVGSALVLQPMLSRLVPVTRVAPHPTRHHPHTRVEGWAVERDGPPEETAASPAPRVPSAADEAPPDPEPPRRTFTGLRIYPERDVILRTTAGDLRIALRPDEAPNTAWNFRHLAEGGFYRDVVFHRVVPTTRAGDPFVIQAGDPSGTGDGGPGYWLPLEPSRLAHDYGVISMARADHPDSAGSQFFIGLSRAGTARLDGQYCAFGFAVDGAATIEAIAGGELADVARGRPVDPPVILEAVLVPAPPRAPGAGRPDARVTRPPPTAPPPEPRPERMPR